MAKTRFYKDLRLMAKKANQRMVEFEKRGIKSPAYEAVQAKLEALGRQTNRATGRRFSETGKATYNEYEATRKILEEFLYKSKTGTVRGAKKYIEDIWQGALKSPKVAVDLQKSGITKQEWFEIWKNLPSKKKDRLYGSSQYIELIAVYKATKQGTQSEIDVASIIKDFENSASLSEAYKGLGLSYKDFKTAENLGVL